MCKVCTGYCGTSEIEHGLCACTVDNTRAKARGLSLGTGAQTMLYLSLISAHNSSVSLKHCILNKFKGYEYFTIVINHFQKEINF